MNNNDDKQWGCSICGWQGEELDFEPLDDGSGSFPTCPICGCSAGLYCLSDEEPNKVLS